MIHILVVDDDAALNKTVCTYLNDCGFETKGVLDAQSAFEEMYNSLYDLIVSDIMMPQMDGFEFARTVRQVNKHIPILFMSAKDDLPSKQKGFQLGIDDYMVKPVELAELEMRVRALLRRVNIEMERKLTVGNLVLDADAVTAEVDGEEIPVGAGVQHPVQAAVLPQKDLYPCPAHGRVLGIGKRDQPAGGGRVHHQAAG